MKAIKSCYAKYLWTHRFKLDFDSFDRRYAEYATLLYRRTCERCKLSQEISVTYGFHFLEKESGGKGTDSAGNSASKK